MPIMLDANYKKCMLGILPLLAFLKHMSDDGL